MAPSLPPLCTIRVDSNSDDDGDSSNDYQHSLRHRHQQHQRQLPTRLIAAPPSLPSALIHRREQASMDAHALYQRVAPVLHPDRQHSRLHFDQQQPRMFAALSLASADDAAEAWRHVQANDSKQLRLTAHRHPQHHHHSDSYTQYGHAHSSHLSRHRSAPTSGSSGSRPTSLDDCDSDVTSGRRRWLPPSSSSSSRSDHVNARPVSRRGAVRDSDHAQESNCALDAATAERSSGSSEDALGGSPSNSNSSSSAFDPTQSKKARRKEQCRVNQANYRKRKRMYENELSGEIQVLEKEIADLRARKTALHEQQRAEREAVYAPELALDPDRDHRNVAVDTYECATADPIKSIGG